MLIGQKGVKYGLDVRGAKPKAKPTAPVQKRSVFGDEDSDEDAGNNVEQQKVRAPCGPYRPLWTRARVVVGADGTRAPAVAAVALTPLPAADAAACAASTPAACRWPSCMRML